MRFGAHTTCSAQFVRSTYWDFWPEHKLASAFAENRANLQAVFKDWVLSPATKEAFIAKLATPQFLAHGEQTHGQQSVPFALMVEAVFDYLSR